MRAQTDDHGCRTQVTFTSKPNSVGFNAVITKTFKAFSTLVSEILPDLTSDFLESLRFMKLDRTTRSGVEGVSAVMFINGVKESAPDRKNFMRPIIMDEGYRSMDAAALNGMVCSIPRDSDGGSGNILKAVDPGKAGGAHLQGHQRQIPGLSPFLVAMTSNSNPHTSSTSTRNWIRRFREFAMCAVLTRYVRRTRQAPRNRPRLFICDMMMPT